MSTIHIGPQFKPALPGLSEIYKRSKDHRISTYENIFLVHAVGLFRFEPDKTIGLGRELMVARAL